MMDLETLDDDDDDDALISALAATPRLTRFVGTERYRLCSCIGEGGFGVVYDVEDRELGQHVALKTLKPQRAGYATTIQRLKREFRSVADLVHPNLVGLHELASDGGRWFFTMELVRGTDLIAYLRRDGVVAAALRACLRQLVAGVAALHDAGIIHRDLKPSNVLVERDGRVVILDFGLADADERSDPDLALAGTPSYMAPEQMKGESATPAVDWYAIGAMLHEAITGKPPDPGRAALPADTPRDLARLCAALLDPDPNRRPHAAAIQAVVGNPDDRPVVDGRRRPSRRLVGRERESAALDAGLAAVARGEPAVVQIHGQPGVGKSALLDDFVGRVRKDRRAVVLAGRCHERESVPFKAFDGVVDELVAYLSVLPRNEASGLMPRDIHLAIQLFPVLEAVASVHDVPRRQVAVADPREVRARAFAALKELIARISDKQPLVIAIDDLQWGDIDSARLLAQLVALPDRPAVLVVLAYRTDEAGHHQTLRDILEALAQARASGTELALAPLASGDAETLAASLLADMDAGAARAIAERGEGHPLFIAELARAHVVADSLAGAPTNLLDLLWKRVSHVSASARALLETIAVAGRPLSRELCFHAAGLGGGGLEAVRVLRAEQLLRAGDGGALDVFHDRVRDAVLARADDDTRRRRHLALARSLEQQPQIDLEALARHFDAAGEAGPAARYALRAGDAAVAGLAFERAVALYRTAIARDGEAEAPSAPAALQEKLGHALLLAGRSVAAGEAFLAAAAEIDPGSRQTELLRLAAEHMLVVGDIDGGMQVLDRALTAVGERLPRTRAQCFRLILGAIVRLKLRGFRFRERDEATVSPDELLRLDVLDSALRGLTPTDSLKAMAIGAVFYRRAIATGEPRRAGRALVGASLYLIANAPAIPATAIAMLHKADAIAERTNDHELAGRALAIRGTIHFMFNDWPRGAEISEAAAAVFAERCHGTTTDYHEALLIAAMCRVRIGHHEIGGQLGEALLLNAKERGDEVYQKQVCAGVLVPLRLAADDPDGARHMIEETGMEPRCASIFLRAEANAAIELYTGNPRAAVEAWRAWWPQLVDMMVLSITGFRPMIVRSYAAALLAAGPDRREKSEIARLIRLLRKSRTVVARAVEAELAALLAIAAGRADRAAQRLFEAADRYDAASAPHDAAACRYRRGQIVGGDDGARETATAGDTLRALGIANPAKWTAMRLPEPAPT
jgi:serine/threonine protein kinase